MAGITQTIPNYIGGISEQPDLLKGPGQVKNIINGVPDVTFGLYKRPGSKRIGTNPLSSVQSGGSWFHYYRDETEGSYVGQIDSTGTVRVWRCSDGVLMNTAYGTGGEAAIKSYLTPTTPEDLQMLTINDTTFVTNRSKTVATTGTTVSRATSTGTQEHQAYIELLRTENGRQYGFNISKSDAPNNATLTRATRLKIKKDTVTTADNTGHCPGIGTQVFSVTAASSYSPTIYDEVAASSVTVANPSVITINNHGFKTEEQIVYTNPSGAALVGIVAGQSGYYVTKGHTDNTFSLSDGKTNALAGVGLEVTNAGSNYHKFAADGDVIVVRNSSGVAQTSGKNNLIFRLTILGQQGLAPGKTGTAASDYQCSYSKELTLLHGGEGWAVGDTILVKMTTALGRYEYTIEVAETETVSVPNTTTSPTNYGGKIVRPTPTPFDSDTAVTTDTILGGITTELSGITIGGNALSAVVIGNGIFLSCASAFNVEITEPDLMRVMQSTINDVTELPNQCKHGYIVKVANARMSDEDDYYLKFDGSNTSDGAGAWTECAAPGIVKGFDISTMPIVIQRTATDTFTVKQFTYPDRLIGDDTTNPIPSFVGGKINKVLFFRNRLAFLSGENVITCRPGTLGNPNFWNNTALTVSATDPIDISSSSMFPSDLYDGIEINTGLLVFSSNQQFLLSSDDAILNPDTAKLRSISTYNYNINIPPVSLGTTVGYIDNSGKFSRFNEMAGIAREGEPIVNEVSKVVPSLLPKDLDLITNSRENQLLLFGKTDSDIIYGLKYFRTSERQVQTAWFKWQLNKAIKYHFIIDDVYYYLDKNNFLQRINIIQSDDPSFIKDANTFNIHIDNYTTVSGGTYDVVTNLTTFTGVSWIPSVTTPNGDLVLIDTNTDSLRIARYAKPTMLNTTDFTVTGDWSSATLNIGYLYEYNVELPRIYPTQNQGQITKKDTNASLVIHRIKLNFGLVGLYETTLSRVGKDDYTEIYESAMADDYNVDDAPYVIEQERIIPVYERNINVDISVKSSHPSPTTLHSMSWEGDYSPRFYKRV